MTYVEISIHALLAESDFLNAMQIVIVVVFLSTLSLRRATAADRLANAPPEISIHALLAESDQAAYFLLPDGMISIHALLAESDLT